MQSSLNAERQRKEAYHKEITRLNKGMIPSGLPPTSDRSKTSQTSSKIKLDRTGIEETDSTPLHTQTPSELKKENMELTNQLNTANKKYETLLDTIRVKDAEISLMRERLMMSTSGLKGE